MDLFPDGGFVRLESHEKRDKYVHADGDWDGVSLRPLALGTVASLEAAWRVEHLAANQEQEQEEGPAPGNFIHLQNAAYGRYLSSWPEQAPPGHRGLRALQSDPIEPYTYLLRWRVERVDPNQDRVRLRAGDSNFNLRANGRHRRWNTGVSVGENLRPRLSTMMQWTVQAVPASPLPLLPPLPVAPPQPQQGGRRGLLFWRRAANGPGVHQLPARTIQHVQANDEGNFDQNHHNWPSFDFNDTTVISLKNELQVRQGWNEDMAAYTLCVRPGSHGRLMPLATDLPRSLNTMNIVVLRTGSPVAAELVYPQIVLPQINAEAQ